MRCVYCQNREIASGEVGREVSVERLAQIFLEQQARGARNINLVTPTQFWPQICEALDMARSGAVEPRSETLEAITATPGRFPYAQLDTKRLKLPIVCNTSGYEKPEVIEALGEYVDVFLTDFKYASRYLAQRYSRAADYPLIASEALDAMFSLTGPASFGVSPVDGEEQLESGVIVRHLMLPGQLNDSKAVMRLLAAKPYAGDIWVSIMSQYTPAEDISSRGYPELATIINPSEYVELIDYALALGLDNSYMQEGASADESFIPAFDYEGV